LGVGGWIKTPGWQKFKKAYPEYGITLSGAADDIWEVLGGIHIPDYKTAKYTDSQDRLAPMYRAQLNGYAAIAESLGMGDVKGISLVYLAPKTDDDAADWCVEINSETMVMDFTPHYVPVDLDVDSLEPLLERARRIYDGDAEPAEGCKDCAALLDVYNISFDASNLAALMRAGKIL